VTGGAENNLSSLAFIGCDLLAVIGELTAKRTTLHQEAFDKALRMYLNDRGYTELS